MVRPSKATRFLDIIDAGVAIMADSGADDMMPHFIYCYTQFYPLDIQKLKEIILKKMREYGIPASILTELHMLRKKLITKEKAKQAATEKPNYDLEWLFYAGSINEDLDSFINNLQSSNKMKDEVVRSFLTPKLTKEDLKLVEENNEEHMRTYSSYPNADVDVVEMKNSDSKDKYLHSECLRRTNHLTHESKETPSIFLRSLLGEL